MENQPLPILIAGVDEAGRGPLAGPVLAAAVILDSARPVLGVADSKTLSAPRREYLYAQITQCCIDYAVAEASVAEIDEHNILQASLLAMRRAVMQLTPQPQHVLVDGRDVPLLNIPATAIIAGDQNVAAISAASIIAKVVRDRMMLEYDQQYPEYNFAAHKGYGTKLHQQKLKRFGPCPIHRRSFGPVKVLLY